MRLSISESWGQKVRLQARLAVLVWLMAGCAVSAHAAQSVILSTGSPPMEIGQGFLARYGNACRFIMPTHVSEQGGTHFRREGRPPAFGTLRSQRDLGDDISLFEVDGVSGRLCGESLSVLPRAVDAALRRVGTAHVRFVNGDGTTGSMAVAIVDNDLSTYLRIKPLVEGERISRGMSGSQLIVNGTSIGMLLSVNARSGTGTVMRQDAMINKIEAFMRQSTQTPPTLETPAEAGNTAFLKLAAWDTLPVSNIQPDTLVTGEGTEPWRVVYEGKPITLDFELHTPSGVWSGVVLDVEGVPPGERPEVVELLMAASPDASSWMSVKTSRLEYANDLALVPIAPRRGALLRLRLSRQLQAGAHAVTDEYLGVRRVEVLP